jgi:hypothetical protein
MNENTVTLPGRASVIKTTSSSQAVSTTSHTTAEGLERVKHLLSNKPLRPPVRPN